MEQKDFLTIKVFDVDSKKLLIDFKFNQDLENGVQEGQTLPVIITENKNAPLLTHAEMNIVWASNIIDNEQTALAEIVENSQKHMVNEDYIKKLKETKESIQKTNEDIIQLCPRAGKCIEDAIQNIEYTIKYYEEYKERM